MASGDPMSDDGAGAGPGAVQRRQRRAQRGDLARRLRVQRAGRRPRLPGATRDPARLLPGGAPIPASDRDLQAAHHKWRADVRAGTFEPDPDVPGAPFYMCTRRRPAFVVPPAFQGWDRRRVKEITPRFINGVWTVRISASRQFNHKMERRAFGIWEKAFRADVRTFGWENRRHFMPWGAACDLLLWQNLARQLPYLRKLAVGVPRRPAPPRTPRATDPPRRSGPGA